MPADKAAGPELREIRDRILGGRNMGIRVSWRRAAALALAFGFWSESGAHATGFERQATVAVQTSAGRLEAAIADLRRIELQGGFTPVPDDATLRPGDRSPAVPLLAKRLRQSGDLAGERETLDAEFYDPGLARAVERFQARHGLERDGVVGRRTFAALNEPVESLIVRATINLARIMDEPVPGPGRHIIVNLPEFQLVAYRDGVPELSMPVIVGRPGRATPILSSPITHLVVNPTWTVPPGILRKDIARRVTEEPDYLARMSMSVIRLGETGEVGPIDPELVDWQAVRSGARGIRVQQPAGPDNPLGRFKFHMDNDQAIYLHDTNEPQLFRRARRALSAGCVRVSDPAALAAFVAEGADIRWRNWSRDPQWQTRWLKLPQPIPVDMVYRTIWVDDAGVLQVREDIYDLDALPASRIAAAFAAAG